MRQTGNKVNSHKRGCAVDIRGTNQGPGCQAFSGWFTALLELSMSYRGKQVVKQLPELSDCSAMNAYSTADHTLGPLPTWLLAATNRLRHTDPGSPLLARRPAVFPPRPGCAAAVGTHLFKTVFLPFLKLKTAKNKSSALLSIVAWERSCPRPHSDSSLCPSSPAQSTRLTVQNSPGASSDKAIVHDIYIRKSGVWESRVCSSL